MRLKVKPLAIAATSTAAIIYGSWNVIHDRVFADMIDGEVSFSDVCRDPEVIQSLQEEPPGVVVSSFRADSFNCTYQYSPADIVSVIGGDNKCNEEAGEYPGVFISNGCDWGSAVDFYEPASSLSESVAVFVDKAMKLQDFGPFPQYRFVEILSVSSDEPRGKYGEPIDWEAAYKVAATPPPVACAICGVQAAVNYLLLED